MPNAEEFWYIAQFTGFNSLNIIKIAEKLKKMFGEDKIFCPIVKERRYNGKKRIFYDIDVPLFFGYIFLRIPCNSDLEDNIAFNITDRVSFLRYEEGGKWAPVPNSDIERLRRENSALISHETVIDTTISIGDVVRFRSGPFCNFVGRVLWLNPARDLAKIITAVFKSETAVETSISNLEIV
jgi:transcriptional antiterminator NusG